MRVISGIYRGRRLIGPRGSQMRPTGDRLKETLFDILSPAIPDSTFVDAFAGTGAIGIEALSRGARTVVFIESSRESLSLIRQNLDACRIAGGFRIVPLDVFTALRVLGREGFACDVFFCDPPYRWTEYRSLLDTIAGAPILVPDGHIIVEHHRKADVPDCDGRYRLVRRIRQGDQCLSIYTVRVVGPAGS
ncbi:MAG: 16S rRNA (guanine(966)-N(2))-methyltransferase RsmD [Acidobacteria bacterium]|nr:16S rRNA (guanine(966)-N(2))-methyltransferase RsmD [Acidobacteriota bacterium]